MNLGNNVKNIIFLLYSIFYKEVIYKLNIQISEINFLIYFPPSLITITKYY